MRTQRTPLAAISSSTAGGGVWAFTPYSEGNAGAAASIAARRWRRCSRHDAAATRSGALSRATLITRDKATTPRPAPAPAPSLKALAYATMTLVACA